MKPTYGLAALTAIVNGKIQIQSEGSEVHYRNIRIRPITAFPAKLLSDSKLTPRQ